MPTAPENWRGLEFLDHHGGRVEAQPLAAFDHLAACAACVSVGGAIFQRPELPNAVGAAIMIGGAGWFLFVQAHWFARRLNVSTAKGAGIAVSAAVRAVIYLFAVLIPVALI